MRGAFRIPVTKKAEPPAPGAPTAQPEGAVVRDRSAGAAGDNAGGSTTVIPVKLAALYALIPAEAFVLYQTAQTMFGAADQNGPSPFVAWTVLAAVILYRLIGTLPQQPSPAGEQKKKSPADRFQILTFALSIGAFVLLVYIDGGHFLPDGASLDDETRRKLAFVGLVAAGLATAYSDRVAKVTLPGGGK